MVRTTKLVPPLLGFRREIDRLFEDSFGNATAPFMPAHAWLPAVDVKETHDALLFELELPGVSEDRLDITCEGGVLAIAGDKETLRKEPEGKYHIVERGFGSFRRSFQLPTNVQPEKIEATMKNGVLLVRVPKAEAPTPKKIAVKAVNG